MTISNPQGNGVGLWLETHHPGYRVRESIDGTYGRVWVMEASELNVSPKGFAAKTFRVSDAMNTPLDIQKILDREIGVWMRMPPHFNVVMALGIDMAHIPGAAGGDIRFPIVRMPLFDGTIRDWIKEPPALNEGATLAVVAQLCNGLVWLYSHGVSGHGHLLPGNVLYQDLRSRFDLSQYDGLPNQMVPWRIGVADFGWAEARRQMGLTDNRWQPYHAPERQQVAFGGAKADTFAVGVILFELLTGVHPAGKPTPEVARWSRSEWLKWANGNQRDLSLVSSDFLRSLLEVCLQPDPHLRPSPAQILQSVVSCAENKHSMPLQIWLDFLNRDAKEAEHLHFGWANQEIAKVRKDLRDEAVEDLSKRLSQVSCSDRQEDKILLVWLARSLVALQSSGDAPSEWRHAYDLLLKVCQLILDEIDKFDWRRAIIYAPPDMSSEEAALDVLHELLAWLSRIAGNELPEVVELRRRLLDCERRIENGDA